MRGYILSLLIFSMAVSAYGQQQATMSQYMFNGLAINPAYAGSRGVLTTTVLARYQSLGLQGAPNTQSFSADAPMVNKKIGLGLLLIRDNISVISQYSINLSYAFRLKVAEHGYFAMGLQAGFNSIKAEYSKLDAQNPNDPAFSKDVNSTRPNFGFGLYYNSDKFYVGLSAPQLANNIFTRGPNLTTIKQDNPIILTGGYLFNLSRAIRFKPSTLLKFVAGQAVEYDINAHLSFDDVLWVGASLKVLNGLDILTEVQVTRQLRIGYSYTFTTNELRTVDFGSHEIMISYKFQFPRDGLISPRSF